jgi:roadblock/LC7 domain-containing protein
MADLERLMTIDGAIAAFRFTPRGELQDSRSTVGELSNTVLDLVSHLCVANMAIATMQARGWESMTGMTGFYPLQGFTMVGFDWTVVVNEEFGVIMSNDKVDYDAAYAELNG